jgi:hypothetical protein
MIIRTRRSSERRVDPNRTKSVNGLSKYVFDIDPRDCNPAVAPLP